MLASTAPHFHPLFCLIFLSLYSFCFSPLTPFANSVFHFGETFCPPAHLHNCFCSHIPNRTHAFIISLNRTHFFTLGSPEHTHTLTQTLTPQSPSSATDRKTNSRSDEVTTASKRGKTVKSSQDLK